MAARRKGRHESCWHQDCNLFSVCSYRKRARYHSEDEEKVLKCRYRDLYCPGAAGQTEELMSKKEFSSRTTSCPQPAPISAAVRGSTEGLQPQAAPPCPESKRRGYAAKDQSSTAQFPTAAESQTAQRSERAGQAPGAPSHTRAPSGSGRRERKYCSTQPGISDTTGLIEGEASY